MCRVWLFCIVSIEKETSVGRIKQRLEDFRSRNFLLVRYRLTRWTVISSGQTLKFIHDIFVLRPTW